MCGIGVGISKHLAGLGLGLKEFVFPPKCLSCGGFTAENYRICHDCLKFLAPLEEAEQRYCCQHGRQRIDCFSIFPLSHVIRQLFVGLKYRHHPKECLDLLRYQLEQGDLRADLSRFWGEKPILVPVPLHGVKMRERGYNQALVLAEVFAENGIVDIRPDLVRRTRNNAKQASLDGSLRFQNASDLFEVRDCTGLGHGAIVLVDDVITTGATLLSMKSELNKVYPERQVLGLSLVKAKLSTGANADFALEQQLFGQT